MSKSMFELMGCSLFKPFEQSGYETTNLLGKKNAELRGDSTLVRTYTHLLKCSLLSTEIQVPVFTIWPSSSHLASADDTWEIHGPFKSHF